MDERVAKLIERWRQRNIDGVYCRDAQEARERVRACIPKGATVGISGSVTLNELGVFAMLEEQGERFLNPYKAGISREESLALRRKGSHAECYLASPNAVAADGTMVFLSAFSNRIVGISEASTVILVAGTNKLVGSVAEAMARAREYATVRNCRRLSWDTPCVADGVCHNEQCVAPVHRRMCCQMLLLESDVAMGRIKVVIVEGEYGF